MVLVSFKKMVKEWSFKKSYVMVLKRVCARGEEEGGGVMAFTE